MKKKVIALMLAMSMTFTFSACGASEDSSSETAQEDSASGTEKAEEETGVEDTEEESDAGEAVSEEIDEETEENEEVNEYGFTESQQEALVESVKNAVTTDFLETYNISPSEFALQPYDVNDLVNYDSDDNYAGDDPYMTSDIWYEVNRAIFYYSDLAGFIYPMEGEDTAYLVALVESALEDGTITIPSTLEDTEAGLTGSEERIALGSAIYKGIVEFLNNLDTREYLELLVNLGFRYINSESIDKSKSIGSLSYTVSYKTTTVFDKVITENIQFE